MYPYIRKILDYSSTVSIYIKRNKPNITVYIHSTTQSARSVFIFLYVKNIKIIYVFTYAVYI